MAVTSAQSPLLGETTCGSLLQQLQVIWDEVGESDDERDKMLLQLEQECLDVYKRKVEQAAKSRAHFIQKLADSNEELSKLLSALGEPAYTENHVGTIKEQLAATAPVLEQLWTKKNERIEEFADVLLQIQKIRGEIAGGLEDLEKTGKPMVDEDDLSQKKLDDLNSQLHELHNEKNDRLHKVLDFVSTVHDLCVVLGMDFFSTITDVHPSLDDSVGVQSKSISDETLSRLAKTVFTLKEDKRARLQKLKELAKQLFDLWNLMDTPVEDRNLFDHVICNNSSLVDEVTVPGALALDLIEQAELEVDRLDQLKASKMKEIAFKKQTELEDIYVRAHIEINTEAARERILTLIDSGNVEPSELLIDMDDQIMKAKEEGLSRKEILEKVEKWMAACEDESWLEDYSQDENRYNSSRGAHLNLKRAEKARILVNKIPALVDTLVAKTRAWEQDHGQSFVYDGVPLLAMLDEYVMLRHEREEAKRRMRDQKRFQEQLSTEAEGPFGSRSSSNNRPHGTKKVVGPRANGSGANGAPARRLSLQSGGKSVTKENKREQNRTAAPANYVAFAKEDAVSHTSIGDAASSSSP